MALIRPASDDHAALAHVRTEDFIILQVTGFVPQDDILLPLLTVEESLLFSARRRLPASYTAEQHVSHVEEALQVCFSHKFYNRNIEMHSVP